MINEAELEYNVKSLVSTWLFGAEDITDLCIIFNDGNKDTSINCNENNCWECLFDVLLDNKENYKLAKLTGKEKGKDKTFGELDIK